MPWTTPNLLLPKVRSSRQPIHMSADSDWDRISKIRGCQVLLFTKNSQLKEFAHILLTWTSWRAGCRWYRACTPFRTKNLPIDTEKLHYNISWLESGSLLDSPFPILISFAMIFPPLARITKPTNFPPWAIPTKQALWLHQRTTVWLHQQPQAKYTAVVRSDRW